LITREDDREPVIRERLGQYEQQTRPVLDYFQQAGIPAFEIDGGAGASPEQIMRQICRSLVSSGFIDESVLAREESVTSGVRP